MDTDTLAKVVLANLMVELADPGTDVVERIGSSYGVEIDTDSGLLHVLFRLDDGDPATPSIIALYLGGQLAADLPTELGEGMLRRLFDLAPWLVVDE